MTADPPLPVRRPDTATARRLAQAIAEAGGAAELARLEEALLRACGWTPRPPEGLCFLDWGQAPDGTEVLRGTEPRPLTDATDARALARALDPEASPDEGDPPAVVAAALERLAAHR